LHSKVFKGQFVTENTFSIREADRAHAFADQLSGQQQAADKVTEAQAVANQRLEALPVPHDENERHLRATIAERERALRDGKEEAHARQRELEMQIAQTRSNAREAVETQLRALVERERVFAAEFAHIKALVDEERRLLRRQYLSSVGVIRSALNEMPQRRFWRNIARKLSGDAKALDLPQVQAERQIHQRQNFNTKINTIEELLALDGHDFIKFAYQKLLGRKPDAPGYAFYMEQLELSGDKAAIICQIGRSREAKQNPISLKGLEGFMRRQKWRRLPILRSMLSKPDPDPKVRRLRRDLEDMDRRIAAIAEGILSRVSQFEGGKLPSLSAQIDALFNSFDDRKYVEAHPDVAASGMNPYEHFVRFGWREKHRLSAAFEVSLADSIPIAPAAVAHVEHASQSDGIKWVCVMQPADGIFQGDCYSLTRLMQHLWTSRPDLQNTFDIRQPNGRLNFLKWLAMDGIDEHSLTARVFPRNLLEELVNLRGDIGAIASEVVQRQRALVNGASKNADLQISTQDPSGANLVGYAFGEFGRGEDVRMVARSLDVMQVPFGIIDQEAGSHGRGDRSVADWVVDGPRFDTNIFLINADLFPYLPFKLGDDFCVGRRNIGYWAWELSKWPVEFELALDMVDEVWAISEFVAESVKTRARVPVITMPNAVTVPQLGGGFTKLRYGLPEDSFVFYFSFDAASHIDRKNPVAVVRAFNVAFPDRETKVHLLLKTMNVELGVPLWKELQKEVAGNARITILTDRMSREEVLGLNLACDAFVSLHRSEGFGRCVAEAMAYGKPVIVTNYSGTRDFAREGTACIVDYHLVPVPAGAYPFCDNQVWAEPDIGHAAALMRRIADDEPYRREIALAGQKFVLENFNEKSIGALYAKRLEEIRASRVAAPTAEESERDSEKVFLGNIDSSTADQCLEASDTIPIEGWMTSPGGIDTVKIYVNSTFVADAHYGVLRPDIHGAFPLLPNAGRSGFCHLLNIAGLADGNHSFSVVARCRSGISRTWTQRFYKRESSKYQEWLQKSDELYMSKIAPGIRRSDGPFLTLVLRLGPMIDKALLRQTLSGLAAQRNSKFELICLMEDGAQQEIVTDTASSVNLTAKCQFLLGKTGLWPSASDQCRGGLIGLVDVGDVFSPWAFSELHESIRENGVMDLIYADEDFIDENGRNDPTFKPGWSPIFLDNYNYIGRPWFASRTAFSSAVSTLSSEGVEFDEHELLKIIGRKDSLVGHIPTVLLSRSSRRVHVQGQAELRNTISESGFDEHWPKVSIIIPTRLGDEELISQCFDGLESNTDYPNFEVIVVVNNVRDPEAEARHFGKRTFKVLHWDGAFNWAGINNLGASQANGELFLFLNDDIEPIEKDWLKILVQTLVRAKAAAIGGLLTYPNGTIQHSGVHFVNYDGGARHLFRFCAGDEARLGWLMNHPREVSAVTGACLLTTRECFNAVNGFDEELPLVGNDTDYCLRVWRNGSSVLVQPAAKLIHHEGVSRQGMSEVKDVKRFWKKWSKFLEHGDFFSNPNLDVRRDDWTVNPSIEKTFKLRSRFSTDQNHSRERYELQDGLFNAGAPANLQQEWQRDSGLRANS
jgi:GT2 family glycosyltransferase/glycosyltransferase involved in cell wall biosynthesis